MNISNSNNQQQKIYIRAYDASDLEELLSLFKLNTPEYFHPDEEKDFITYMSGHASTYYIASLTNILVGGCGFHYTTAGEGRISWTFVHPDFKGKGIGKSLVDHCLQMMRHKMVSKITVWTSNLAWLFYQKFGFELKEIKKDYWAKDLDLYYMEIG